MESYYFCFFQGVKMMKGDFLLFFLADIFSHSWLVREMKLFSLFLDCLALTIFYFMVFLGILLIYSLCGNLAEIFLHNSFSSKFSLLLSPH